MSFSAVTIEKVESSTLSVGVRDLKKEVLLQGKQERLFHPVSHVGISPWKADQVHLGSQLQVPLAPHIGNLKFSPAGFLSSGAGLPFLNGSLF